MGFTMRMGNYRWLLACLVLFSANSFALDYYWSNSTGDIGKFQTPLLACGALVSRSNLTNPRITYVTDVRYFCYGTNANGQSQNVVDVRRSGNTCTAPSTYDPATHSCVAPLQPGGEACGPVSPVFGFPKITNSAGQCVDWPQLDKPSACKYLGANAGTQVKTVRVSFDGDGTPVKPDAEDALGCELAVIDASECKLPPMKCTTSNGLSVCTGANSTMCKVGVTYTGNVAGSNNGLGYVPIAGASDNNEGVCADAASCELEELPTETEKEPCVYTVDGEGRRVCSSANWEHKPGENSCGTVNGEFQCISKKPTSNGISVGTVVEEKNNPDGTKTTTKTDTLKQTTCIGAGSCTTQTTVNKTVTVKNGAGETVSQTGSCTGKACASNGKGDADGDGMKDCTGTKCEEEEETEEVGAQDWYQKGEDTIGSVFEDFGERLNASPVVSSVDNFFTLNAGGPCPVWSANTWVFDVRIDQHCTTEIPWDLIRAIVLSCAAFLAFRWAIL